MNIEKVYGVKHKDETVRALSRSGGIFTALTDIILDKNGTVYGCALNADMLAEHRRAVTKEERDSFRGSKYIQSNINDCYALCLKDLRTGIPVLFSGTPCQIEGLKNYLNIKGADSEKLITVDILCHGVPSPMVWKDFLEEKFSDKSIDAVDFRDKKNFGWRNHIETVTADGKEESSRVFTDLFYSHLILRPSCFECNYKRRDRVSDITIGDYWRIENNDKLFDDDKGVSLVKINSEKGKMLFSECKESLIIKEFPLATSIQPALRCNYSSPVNREEFWKEYSTDTVENLMKKYTSSPPPTVKQRINTLVYAVMHKMKLI